MALADDLLLQAHHLATLDKGRPKQANLRRAVSSAYYAVFHLLVSEAVHSLISRRPAGLANRVSRAFSHGEIRQACTFFLRAPMPPLLKEIKKEPISNSLLMLAASFVELQEARHSADYDVGAIFTRATVLARLGDAEDAFHAWRRIRTTDEATIFLTALAFGARWAK